MNTRSVQPILKLVLAVLLILLGLLGLVLPVLQGVLFLMAGLILLSDVIRPLRRIVQRWEKGDARFARIADVAHRKIDRLFARTWLVLTVTLIALASFVAGVYILLELS